MPTISGIPIRYIMPYSNMTTGKAKEFKGKEYDSLRKALGKEFSLLPEPDNKRANAGRPIIIGRISYRQYRKGIGCMAGKRL